VNDAADLDFDVCISDVIWRVEKLGNLGQFDEHFRLCRLAPRLPAVLRIDQLVEFANPTTGFLQAPVQVLENLAVGLLERGEVADDREWRAGVLFGFCDQLVARLLTALR
jgi:hypothetical protein